MPFRAGDFIGSVSAGAPVNFFDVKINPHGNGTHTECLGHITRAHESVNQSLTTYHFMARLVTIPIRRDKSGDEVVMKADLPQLDSEALILRTEGHKLDVDYSDQNPPYLEAGFAEELVNREVSHLLLDLPSVDKEQDGGALVNHKAFWKVEEKEGVDEKRRNCTITELIAVPDWVEDGLYLLNLQLPSLELDAAPSRPVLFYLEEIEL